MATFPLLIPSARTYTPGVYPHSAFNGMSGVGNRVRNSNVVLGSQLRLTFSAITEAQMLSILTHYQGQQGTFQSFPLPSATWSGGSSADYQIGNYGWRYINQPTVSDAMCANAYNVELTLETVPPEGTAAAGLDSLVRTTLAAGVATASFNLNVILSLTAGDATAGVTIPGLTRNINWTIEEAPSVNPIPDLSPALWYDFADESTVTVSSSQITQITDKGSRGWTLTKSATGPGYVTGINGLKCADWGSASHQNYLRNTSTTSTSIAEVFIVLDANFGSTFPTFNGLISATASGWILGGNNGGAGFWPYSNLPSWLFDSAFINGSTSNVYDSAILPAINSPVILRMTRTAGPLTANDGFVIGNDRTFYSRGWGGLIGEVVVFSSVLSSTDRAAVEEWLAYKWGIALD